MFPNSNLFKVLFLKGKWDLNPNWIIVDAVVCDFDKSFGSYRACWDPKVTRCERWGLWQLIIGKW